MAGVLEPYGSNTCSTMNTGHPIQNSADARRQLVHAIFGRKSRTRVRWKAETITLSIYGMLILILSTFSFSMHFSAFSDTEI